MNLRRELANGLQRRPTSGPRNAPRSSHRACDAVASTSQSCPPGQQASFYISLQPSGRYIGRRGYRFLRKQQLRLASDSILTQHSSPPSPNFPDTASADSGAGILYCHNRALESCYITSFPHSENTSPKTLSICSHISTCSVTVTLTAVLCDLMA